MLAFEGNILHIKYYVGGLIGDIPVQMFEETLFHKSAIIIIINLYAPSPFEVWGAARYLANGEKPSMDKPHAA